MNIRGCFKRPGSISVSIESMACKLLEIPRFTKPFKCHGGLPQQNPLRIGNQILSRPECALAPYGHTCWTYCDELVEFVKQGTVFRIAQPSLTKLVYTMYRWDLRSDDGSGVAAVATLRQLLFSLQRAGFSTWTMPALKQGLNSSLWLLIAKPYYCGPAHELCSSHQLPIPRSHHITDNRLRHVVVYPSHSAPIAMNIILSYRLPLLNIPPFNNSIPRSSLKAVSKTQNAVITPPPPSKLRLLPPLHPRNRLILEQKLRIRKPRPRIPPLRPPRRSVH